jgi:uncharacterized protein (TIGR03437 family)
MHRLVIFFVLAGTAAAKPALTYVARFGRVYAVATGPDGSVYAVGSTTNLTLAPAPRPSGDCSMIPNRPFRPCEEAFVAHLDPRGATIQNWAYIGGYGPDSATAVAVDREGNAYVAGVTSSGDFPGSEPAEQKFASTRIFAVKVSPRGQLLYSRLFPAESGYAEVYRPNPGPPIGIAVNARGEAVVVGSTVFADFPTRNAIQSAPIFKPIHFTPDGGAAWRTLSFQDPVKYVTALAVDARDPNVLWAGTELGVYRSADAGTNWKVILRDPSGGPVTAMVIDSKDPSTVYAAFDRPGTDFHVAPGLWKITEGGAKYESVYNGFQGSMPFAGGPLPTITALAIDPVNPSNLWAGTTGYIYRSTDAGANWVRGAALDPPFPSPDPGGGLRLMSNISRILVDTRDPSRLYACCVNRSGTGIFRSEDAGATWQEGQAGPPAGSWGPNNPALDPRDGRVLWAPWYHGVARSGDAGESWEEIAVPKEYEPDKFVDSAFDREGNLYVLSSTGLILRRAAGAETWTALRASWSKPLYPGPRDVSLLAFSPRDPRQFWVNTPSSARSAFAVKLDAAGATEWATLLGGAGEDRAVGVAFDAAGDVWVSGTTTSTDFPTVNPLQEQRVRPRTGDLSGADLFLAKIVGAGGRLLYSTYLGGGGDETSAGLGLDAAGNVYFTGEASDDFPVMNPAPGTEPPQYPTRRVFAAALDGAGARLIHSTFVGSNWNGGAGAPAVGPDGTMYVAGCGVMPQAAMVDPIDAIPGSAFLAAIAPGGGKFIFGSSFFGCSGGYPVRAPALAIGANRALWIGGDTVPSVGQLGPGFTLDPVEGFLTRIDFAPAPVAGSRVISVRNAASLQLGETFAPGSLVSVFGENLAGATVWLGGVLCPILYASDTQINFQIPFDAPARAELPLELRVDGETRDRRTVRTYDSAPGIFTLTSDGRGEGIVVHSADWTLVTRDKPATPGEILTFYATGLGAVNGPVMTGEPAPMMPLPLRDDSLLTVAVDSRVQRVLYAGLAPGFIGVYQINFVFDPAAGAGPNTLTLTLSNPVTIYSR